MKINKTIYCIFAYLLSLACLAAESKAGIQDLNATVLTGTKTERLLSEAPVKTELYTADRLGEYNFTTLRDAIKLVPSARFEADCQNCGLNQIQLLGLSTEYTSILFDGAPLYSGLAKVYGADLFPAVFIDRIEVVKGGGSVLYGPEAIAGVVNLIPARPIINGARIKSSLASLKGKSTEYKTTGKADYISKNKKHAFSFYGLYEDREELDLGTDGFTEIPKFENKVAGLQWWYDPRADTNLKLTYQYVDEAHRGGDQLNLAPEEARTAESLAHRIHLVNFDWSSEIDEKTSYNLRGSTMQIFRESFYGARSASEQTVWENAGNPAGSTPTGAFIAANQQAITNQARRVWGESDNAVYFLEGQVDHELDKHLISAGVQYRFEIFKDATPYNPTIASTKDSFANIGAFLQDQWRITDKFELVPGIRADKHDNAKDFNVSPRVAAIYKYSDHLAFRAGFSTGFNAPGAFNEDEHITVNTEGQISLTNAAGLKEESSQTYSFGLDYLPEYFKKQMILSSTLYYTKLKDAFDIDDSNANAWLRINGPNADILVWENALEYQIDDHLRLSSGVSYTYVRLDTAVARVTGLTTKEYLERPEITAFTGLNYSDHDLFDTYALLDYTGSMIATSEDTGYYRDTPDFFDLNLGISKAFHPFGEGKDLVLSVGVDNVFDHRQKDIQENGENRDPTYFYGPARPRTFHMSASIQF